MKSRKAKVLHEAGGKALVEHVVDSSLALTSPDRVIVVVGHQADQVKSRLASRRVSFAVQTEQKGTGHALEMCRAVVPGHSGHLVLLYGDTPLVSRQTLERLVEHHSASGAAATVLTAEIEDPTGYGRIIRDSENFIHAIVEHKVATEKQRAIREINSGMYCFDAELLWKHLSQVEENPTSREFYLTDIVEILNRAGHRVSPLVHDDFDELLGINTRVELAYIDGVFRQRKAEQLMLSGVTIRKPESVIIDTSARVGMDTVIGPFAQILGSTVIGDDCVIGAGAVIQDSELENGVVVEPYTFIHESRVQSEASVGPFARVRPGSQVGPKAHIGNFVELKKTSLGPGAKAGHLAYLGDSEIGSGVNVGAGTITCNYDGARKHKTIIGEGVFVGSNSTLVAPLELGAGSYVGAGSVVTERVPEDALAVGRSRQANKEGWAKRRREQLQARDQRSKAEG